MFVTLPVLYLDCVYSYTAYVMHTFNAALPWHHIGSCGLHYGTLFLLPGEVSGCCMYNLLLLLRML